jgi:hypothetical protein
MEVFIELIILHPLAPFYPAGIEGLRVYQAQSVFNAQPHYNAVDLTAKENEQK